MNKVINQYAYKGDGSFHRLWLDAEVLKETRDYIITKTPIKTKVVEKNGYSWRSKEKAINYFSKTRWFNLIIMYKNDDNLDDVIYYCNIATPCFKEGDSIKYVDYDLDVKYFPKTKKIKILDENEYVYNAQKYEYTDVVKNKIDDELKILIYWITNEIGPFSHNFRDKWKKY